MNTVDDKEIILIDTERYFLDGWNGNTFANCRKISTNEKCEIKPILQQVGEDDFDIIDFEIKKSSR